MTKLIDPKEQEITVVVEGLFSKPISEITEEDIINRALNFRLSRVMPDEFFAMDKEARRSYAQEVINYFHLTATQFVVEILNPDDDKCLKRFQNRLSSLGVKPARVLIKKPIKACEYCDEAYDLWLNREAKETPVSEDKTVKAIETIEIEETAEAFLDADFVQPIKTDISFEMLLRRELVPGRNIYELVGNVTGFFSEQDIKEIVQFCPLKAVSYEELIAFPFSVQKRYLEILQSYFKATRNELLVNWFNEATTFADFTDRFDRLGVCRLSYYRSSQDISKIIRQCAKHIELEATGEETKVMLENTVPPIAESNVTLLPNGEVILDHDLEQKPSRPRLMFHVSLNADLSIEEFEELANLVKKYRDKDKKNIHTFSAQFLENSLT